MKLNGAIFDLDGTLLDSMPIWNDVGKKYLLAKGHMPTADLNNHLKTCSLTQSAEYFQTTYGITDSVDQILSDIENIVCRFYTQEAVLKPGVAALLSKFQAQGISMCIATATQRSFVEQSLARNGVLSYFSEIFTCTELSTDKGKPDIFEAALSSLHTDKTNTAVFEDALHAIETAKQAGFYVVGVYDPSAQNDWGKIKQLADCSLLSLEEWKDE